MSWSGSRPGTPKSSHESRAGDTHRPRAAVRPSVRVPWVAVIPAQRALAATSPPEPATHWALAARSGDPTAQAAFVRATQAEVWRFAAALVDPDAADDLTQETYLRAFRALPGFEGRSSARTWLLGIARRACADHLRAVIRRRRLDARLAAEPHRRAARPGLHLGAADLLGRLPGGSAQRVRADPGAGPVVRGGGRDRGRAGGHDPFAGRPGARRPGRRGRRGTIGCTRNLLTRRGD